MYLKLSTFARNASYEFRFHVYAVVSCILNNFVNVIQFKIRDKRRIRSITFSNKITKTIKISAIFRIIEKQEREKESGKEKEKRHNVETICFR